MNTTNETDRRTARQRKAQDHVPRPAGTKGIGRPQEYTVEQVEAALRATFGNLTAAATALKFERGTLYTYLERYPHLKEIRPAKRRKLVEIAEDHLFAAVKLGKQWACNFLRLAGFALAGSFAFAQPSDGRLKIIHETATLRVAYRTGFTAVLVRRRSGPASRLHNRTLRTHSKIA
jgi:hypothetical protein